MLNDEVDSRLECCSLAVMPCWTAQRPPDLRLPTRRGNASLRGDLTERAMSRARIVIPKEQIAEFCRRHHIRRLALFGSVLREDFRPDSDVDVLVEFEPGRPVGLIRLARIERELSELLGRKVDLNTAGFLSRHFRGEVLSEAEVQYVAP